MVEAIFKSLNTSFLMKMRKWSDIQVVRPSIYKNKMFWGLENVFPELETIAKLKDKEAVSGRQRRGRDDCRRG